MIFRPYGSKDLHNLEPFGLDLDTVLEIYKRYPIINKIIMHDQEPLFLDYIDTYKLSITHQKNAFENLNELQTAKIEKIARLPESMSTADILKKSTGKHPGSFIICHSEQNSKDVRILVNNGFVDCYYWWHGLIARDWFRHWQYYDGLAPKNKSLAEYRFLLYARDFSGTRQYRKTLINHCRRYQQQILYQWNGEHVSSDYSAKIEISDSEKSAVHLVAETLFETDKIYLTEKIFKPMVMSQPFILFGPPKSLQYLKQYGFKTFNDVWDESYDLESDPDIRMTKILGLVDHLAMMSTRDFDKLYKKSLPIIKHNRQRFFSQSFQNDLIHEMCVNMEKALFEQYQRHQHRLDDESSADSHDV